MSAQVTVQTSQIDGKKGFSVILKFRPPFEDMFEIVEHHVVFESAVSAQNLANRVNEAIKAAKWSSPLTQINLDHWTWAPSLASPFLALQRTPVARKVFRPIVRI